VQRTGGSLRLRQAFFWLRHFSALGVLSRPAHPPLTPTVRRQGFPNLWNFRKWCDVVSPAMAREGCGVLSTMARYNDGVLQAVARNEAGVLPIKSCPLPSLVRRLEVDPDPACRLTMRAADGWESAASTSIFLASSFFCSRSFISSRPPAANANRWAD
jgi:hypothetical protein